MYTYNKGGGENCKHQSIYIEHYRLLRFISFAASASNCASVLNKEQNER
tara:strand:- start:806 stop:952 length:147 start_codon:yes stop_codon:yes gene_type:complete